MIKLIISIVALVSLYILWHSPYNILWWIILALFILDWITGETVKTASKNGSEVNVIKFWVWTNMVISISCLASSIIGIIISF